MFSNTIAHCCKSFSVYKDSVLWVVEGVGRRKRLEIMETTETVKGMRQRHRNKCGKCGWMHEQQRKDKEMREKHKYVLKCVIGHRWGTCLCCTFRFDDVWMLSKLLLEEKRSYTLGGILFLAFPPYSSPLVVKSWLLLPPCCLAVIKQVNWKTAPPQSVTRNKRRFTKEGG